MIIQVLIAVVLLPFSVIICVPSYAVEGAASGSLAITGNGPEQHLIEKLARAFEKANPRAYVDVLWDENSKPVEIVLSGQAQIAVTGREDPNLGATQIGWDGIAVMVNLSNHTKEVTSRAGCGNLFRKGQILVGLRGTGDQDLDHRPAEEPQYSRHV